MSDLPTVAVLGTGAMGAGMARSIAAAGLPVRVWNRSRERALPLTEVGAEVAGTPSVAVTGADVVLTMLFDADSVADVVRQAAPGLAPGTVWLQTSTVGVAGERALADLADRLGLSYVDAPVLGTKEPAENGALVVLAGGPDDARDRVAPVLDAIGSRTLWVGPAGAASRLKLVANQWVLTVLEGVAECLTLAASLDLDPQLFLDAVRGGAVDAPYVQAKGAAMLKGSFDPSFAVSGAAKDAALIEAATRAAGLQPGLIAVIRAHLQRAVDDGHADLDMSATYLSHRTG